MPGVAFAAPRIEIEPYKILAAGAKTKAQVYGVGHRHREVTPFALAEGRFFDARDETHHAQVCVIGAGVRRDLFGADPALGQDVKINDVWFEVIGVLAPEADAGRRRSRASRCRRPSTRSTCRSRPRCASSITIR